MDPLLIAVAGKVAGFLSDFVLETTEDLRKRLGVAAVDKVTDLLKSLRRRWASDPEATTTLNAFEGDPEAHKAELENVLVTRMEKDSELAKDLNARANDIRIVVEQRVTKGKFIEGAEFGDVKKGDITHEQEVGEGEQIKGPKFGDIG